MRKNRRVLILATIVAAVVVPVGFTLSLDSRVGAVAADRDDLPAAQVVMQRAPFLASTTAAVSGLPAVPEGAKLLVIGGLLFGVAAAMRRTTGEPRS